MDWSPRGQVNPEPRLGQAESLESNYVARNSPQPGMINRPVSPSTTSPANISHPNAAVVHNPTSFMQSSFRGLDRKATLIAFGAILFIIGVATTSFLLLNSHKSVASQSPVSASFRSQQLAVTNSNGYSQLLSGPGQRLQVNGQLKVTNTIVLAPTTTPTAPILGQLYFDQGTNKPYYYNGVTFKDLSSTTGATIAGAGDNTSLTLGSGLALQGTSLTNAGVTSLRGTPNQISVSGSTGNLSLSLPANLTLTGAVSAAQFQGNFTGDGSKLTNLSALGCQDCVRLQGTNPVAQTGTISVAGNIAATGQINGSNLQITGSAANLLNVQDLNGASVLSVDAQQHRIAVNLLVPTTPGSVQQGGLIRGHLTTSLSTASNGLYNDNDHWSRLGSDGYTRFAYTDGTTVHYVRCQDVNCATKIDQVLEVDSVNGMDGPVIALDTSGNAYVLYMVYSNPNVYHLVHCLDQDCAQTSIQTVASAPVYGYNYGLTVDSTGLPHFVFDTYNTAPYNSSLEYIQCLNIDCSSSTQTEIVTKDSTPGSGFYETSTIATGNDGLSRFAYIDEGLGKLIFVRCLNASCTQRTSTQIDEGNYYVSLAIGSDGLAKMTYQGLTNTNEIRYARCNNADCTSTSLATIGNSLNSNYSSLALDQNNIPHISYQYRNDPTYTAPVLLMLATCSDTSCNNVTTVQPEILGSRGYCSSLQILPDGSASIVYFYRDSYSTASINLVHVITPDGQDIKVSSVQSNGTDVGTSADRFGTVYSQQINLQSATSGSSLVINQIGTDTLDSYGNIINVGTGSIAQFQINGHTKAEFDKNGTFITQAATGQTVDLQQAKSSDGTVVSGTNSRGLVYASDQSANLLAIGLQDKNLLTVNDASNQLKLAISSSGSLQLGAGALETQKLSSFTAFGTYPFSINAVDLNGDGKKDIVAVGQIDVVVIALSTGNNTLSTPKLYSAPGVHYSVSIADVNGDGKPDIIAADNGNSVYVLINDGTGAFPTAQAYTANVDTYTTGTAVADLNGDGKLDIVVSSYYSTNYAILLGNGDGTFGAAQISTLSSVSTYSNNLENVAALDLNGDGKADLIFKDGIGSHCYVKLNNGDGTFGATVTYSDPGDIMKVVDVNGDGIPDILSDSSILINNGSGVFTQKDYRTGTSTGLEFADSNNDGKPDIQVTSGTNILIYDNLGNGNFASVPRTIPVPGVQYVVGVVVADINGNGVPSTVVNDYNHIIVVSPQVSPKLQASLNDPSGTGLLLLGVASQTGDFLQVQDVNQKVLTRIDSSGVLVSNKATINALSVSTIQSAASTGLKGTWYPYGGYQNGPAVDSKVIATTIDGPLNYTSMYSQHPAEFGSGTLSGQQIEGITALWTGWVKADYTGTYTFYAHADDEVRVSVNQQQLIDSWSCCSLPEKSGTINLTAGNWYPISVQYGNRSYEGSIYLKWSEASIPKDLVPADHLSPIDPATITAQSTKVQVLADLQISSKLQDATSMGSFVTFNPATSGGAVEVDTQSASNTGLVIKGSAAQASDLQQWQDSNNAVLAKLDSVGNLTVKAGTFNGSLTVLGHVITGNTSGATTALIGTSAGVGAVCAVSGNDTAGTVTITSGTSATATGTICTVTFANAFASSPKIVMTARTASGALLPIYQTSSASNFLINAATSPTTSTIFSYDYTAVQ
jgi:hypothetical protein